MTARVIGFLLAVEARVLAALLRRVARRNYYFSTEESFRAYHALRSQWAVELVIFRYGVDGNHEILLTRYGGGILEFRGKWHIPGGYDIPKARDFQETCSRIGRRELGVDVSYARILGDPYKWKRGEHPYAVPLSIYVLCQPNGPIEERASVKFFPLSQLPQDMVEPHRRFLEACGATFSEFRSINFVRPGMPCS